MSRDLTQWRRFMIRHLEALAELIRARIRLVAVGWRQVVDEADRLAGRNREVPARGDELLRETIECVERALHRVSRLVPGARCIQRSVAGQRMLARRGIGAELVIGLRADDEIRGHAWLEVPVENGEALSAFVDESGGFQPVS